MRFIDGKVIPSHLGCLKRVSTGTEYVLEQSQSSACYRYRCGCLIREKREILWSMEDSKCYVSICWVSSTRYTPISRFSQKYCVISQHSNSGRAQSPLPTSLFWVCFPSNPFCNDRNERIDVPTDFADVRRCSQMLFLR